MKLSKNFYLHEFNCNDGTVVPEELIPNVKELVKNLQLIRYYYNIIYNLAEKELTSYKFKIVSGFRTKKHNDSVDGSKNSQHLYAKAADIKVYSVKKRKLLKNKVIYEDPFKLYSLIEFLIKEEKIKDGGLGKYNSFTHYDIRNTSARW
jgi:hypothetical protein